MHLCSIFDTEGYRGSIASSKCSAGHLTSPPPSCYMSEAYHEFLWLSKLWWATECSVMQRWGVTAAKYTELTKSRSSQIAEKEACWISAGFVPSKLCDLFLGMPSVSQYNAASFFFSQWRQLGGPDSTGGISAWLCHTSHGSLSSSALNREWFSLYLRFVEFCCPGWTSVQV